MIGRLLDSAAFWEWLRFGLAVAVVVLCTVRSVRRARGPRRPL